MGYKTAIQNLLVNTAFAGEFYKAEYSVDFPSLLSEGDDVLPRSIESNEVRGVFGIDESHGRDRKEERQGWAWLLVIRFTTEVVLEHFEQALLDNPLTIARNTSEGRPCQVLLTLEDSAPEHPPRGGASNGTQVTYRFVAHLCR